MLNSKELRVKAWNSLKGKYWMAFVVTLVMGVLASFGSTMISTSQQLMEVVGMVEPAQMDSTMAIGALVVSGISLVICLIGLAISVFVGNAAEVGLANYYIKNTDSNPTFADAFLGFKVKYGRNIGTLLLMGIKIALWSLLFVIPGIIKTYEYAMIPYILADDAEISSKEAFKKSKAMMNGNKWRLFKLNFSFIGWTLLAIVTCGVGTFFLVPYVAAANAEFYVELKNK